MKEMFGSLPDDDEVTAIDRRALEAMAKAGAEVVDVVMHGVDDQMRLSSVIDAEFKFDLIQYLSRWPNAPVHSLHEILERGDYAAALDANFKRRDARTSPDTPDVVHARAKRTELSTLVAALMHDQKLDVLAYPTLRRKAALIGEPQRGAENCQLAPSTGLPAISMPAGFTDDGVPVGVELLGAAWSEPRLLSMAYAYEQAVHPRRAPSSTPALTGGRPPAATGFVVNLGGAHVTFTFDPSQSSLAWDAVSTRPLVASLHRGRTGPALATLMTNKASESAGTVVLQPSDRAALGNGGLVLTVRTMEAPEAVQHAPLKMGAP